MKHMYLLVSTIAITLSSTLVAQSDLINTVVTSKNHSTLLATVKAAELVITLKGEGPYTIFAPVNEAFDALPAGAIESLLKPESKGKLSNTIKHHVIPGNFTASDIIAGIKQGGGKLVLKTIGGGTITASIEDGNIILQDFNGGKGTIIATDIYASNGVIHSIDTVLIPQ